MLPNEIREPLLLENAKSGQLTIYHGEKGPKCVLQVSAPLTLAIAEVLGLRNQFFDGKDLPYLFTGAVGLTHLWKAVDVDIEGIGNIAPEIVHKFRIEHDGDLKLLLNLRIHFSEGHVPIIHDWFLQTNKETFTLTVTPKQQELFDGQDGTRVALSDGDGRTLPASSPEFDDDPEAEAAAPPPGSSTLSSVAEMRRRAQEATEKGVGE